MDKSSTNQRGEYGPSRVVAASPEVPAPWWKFAIGTSLLVGVGYILSRAATAADWPAQSVPKIREQARAAGIKPWMSKAEMMRLWSVHNAKLGRPATPR